MTRTIHGQVRVAALLLALMGCACGGVEDAAGPPSAEGWYEFEGSWGASGQRRQLQLGSRGTAVAQLSGSLLLSGPSRPGAGFRGEAVVFSDEHTGLVGRAVWTDERGDEVWSELQAAQVTPGARIAGTFVGGTGRFAGAEGGYEFEWAYLIDSDDGAVQGHTLELHGRIRAAVAPPGGAPR